jgi:hypothetical protein
LIRLKKFVTAGFIVKFLARLKNERLRKAAQCPNCGGTMRLVNVTPGMFINGDALIMLTDVKAVETNFGTPGARPIRHATAEMLASIRFLRGQWD